MFVFFPIAILIGGLYYFFKDYDDNRYEVRNYYTSRGNKYYNRNLYSLEMIIHLTQQILHMTITQNIKHILVICKRQIQTYMMTS